MLERLHSVADKHAHQTHACEAGPDPNSPNKLVEPREILRRARPLRRRQIHQGPYDELQDGPVDIVADVEPLRFPARISPVGRKRG
jgi:hypothetical protein